MAAGTFAEALSLGAELLLVLVRRLAPSDIRRLAFLVIANGLLVASFWSSLGRMPIASSVAALERTPFQLALALACFLAGEIGWLASSTTVVASDGEGGTCIE